MKSEIVADSDGALARRIATSKPGVACEAETELYRRYARRAWLFGLRRLREEQAAADLAQDAMLVAIERLRAGEISEPDRVGSFILGTCRMLLRNEVRTTRRRREILDSLLVSEAVETEDPPRFDRADMDRLIECMRRLSERARTVILLAFYADRSAADIATELRTTPGNVRVIRHRAIADLRWCIDSPA